MLQQVKYHEGANSMLAELLDAFGPVLQRSDEGCLLSSKSLIQYVWHGRNLPGL